MNALRPIMAMRLPDVARAPVQDWKPEQRWVAPTSLLVDEGYQRSLSDRSVALIRRIVANWDWAAFKPPVCVEDGRRLHVIDGQHTAIAAASHGQIPLILVMVVRAPAAVDRARAFVAHNRDRVVMTPLALHHAMVAAGEEEAIDVAKACRLAGVKLLKNPPPAAFYEPGETIAVGTVRTLVRRRYVARAKRVLAVCAAARLAPIGADHIKAAEAVLFSEDRPDADVLAAALMRRELMTRAKTLAAERGTQVWKTLAEVIGRAVRRAA